MRTNYRESEREREREVSVYSGMEGILGKAK